MFSKSEYFSHGEPSLDLENLLAERDCRNLAMNWQGRVGEIREVCRNENGFCFEWKIPDIFSMPDKIGGVHFSPELQFLGAGWSLGIYKNTECEPQEWIGIELWRAHEISSKPIHFSLGIRKADGTEEQVHRNQIYPDKCGFCGVSKFLNRHYLLSCKRYLAPSNALTISCTLWKDEPPSMEEDPESVAEEEGDNKDRGKNSFSSFVARTTPADLCRQDHPGHSTSWTPLLRSQLKRIRTLSNPQQRNWLSSSQESKTDDFKVSNAAEEERESLDSTAEMVVPHETHTEGTMGAVAGHKKYTHLDIQAKMVVSPEAEPEITMGEVAEYEECTQLDTEGKSVVSCGTQTDDTLVAGPSGQGREDLGKEGKRFDSCETQTEDVSDASARVEGLSHLDIEGLSTLRKHFEDMLLSGDDYDVVIKIKNQNQEFNAHKNVLRARSPVFAAMFKHKMKENTDGTVTIEDVDPETFGEFLHYVYTGVVENLSPSKAIGLYYAGDKYDFPGLKVMAIEFLKASLSTTLICDIITLAIRYNENDLLERAMGFFSEHLEEIMNTAEWHSFLPANHMLANQLLLKAMKNWRDQSGDFSAKTPSRN